jgi:hypothetical protein
MATLAELQDALVNADKAGDAEAAQQLADAIVSMQAQPQSERPSQSPIRSANNMLDMAYRATPLGLIQTAQQKGNEFVQKGADYLADKTIDATGSPALATAVKFSPDIAGLVAGGYVANKLPNMLASGRPAQAAQRLGMTPTIGQRTNNPTILQVEDTMRRMPGSGGVFGAHDERNMRAINKAAAKAIGESSDKVTGEVLANADDALGAARNSLRDDVNIPQLDMTAPASSAKNVIASIGDAAKELKKGLRSSGSFERYTEDIKRGMAQGNVSGEQYQIWRTDLRDARETAFKAGKTMLGKAYDKVLRSLDDAARGTAGEAWKANDRAFSTLDILQKGNVVNPETGNVSAPLLTNEFYRRFGKTAKQGKMPGEIADIATVQRAYPKWAEGSPTGKVENYSSLIPWLMSPASFAGAKLLTSNPMNIFRYAPYAVQGGLLYDNQ